MLYLIGLGFDEKDLSLKGLEIAEKCECYCELYTSYFPFKGLEEIIGKNIIILKRSDLEEDLNNFLEKAKEKDIVLFVPGDPLVATTHIDLVIEAKKKQIPVKIIHNSSIFSAIAETGLHLYKFGKTATIPFTKQLESVKETLEINRKNELHTLLLLDIDYENKKYMSVKEALEILLENNLLDKKDKIIAAHIPEQIIYDKVENLIKRKISTPSVLIIPGKLHFREKEFLDIL